MEYLTFGDRFEDGMRTYTKLNPIKVLNKGFKLECISEIDKEEIKHLKPLKPNYNIDGDLFVIDLKKRLLADFNDDNMVFIYKITTNNPQNWFFKNTDQYY
jgi:hypothetical protein